MSRLSRWRSRPKGRSEAMGVADLRTQSPPLAITLGEIIGANDPKATATQGHAESVASFQFFGPARYGRWLDSRRYRRRDSPLRRQYSQPSSSLLFRAPLLRL